MIHANISFGEMTCLFTVFKQFLIFPVGTFTINTTVNCIYDCKVDSTMTIHHAECLESGSYYTCSADNGVTGPVSKKSLNRMLVKCEYPNVRYSLTNVSTLMLDIPSPMGVP